MAKHLDLEEQEQLDQLKHFWNQYGNLITWVLIAVFGSVAAWNGWQYWQRTQSVQASALYEEVNRAAQMGDAARLDRSFADMKDKFGGTVFAQQAGLLVAKTLYRKGQRGWRQGGAHLGGRQGRRPRLPVAGPAASGQRAARSQGL
jgi:predicted negative regulator of RcsB-dependent stress response